jgi:hypothetical protein
MYSLCKAVYSKRYSPIKYTNTQTPVQTKPIRSKGLHKYTEYTGLEDSKLHGAVVMGTLLDKIKSTHIQTKLPVSVEGLIELATQKAWTDYGYKVARTEVERVIEDSTGIEDCTYLQINAWANALVIRMIQQRGQIPNNWNQVSRCARCGPVWSDHGIDTLSCGWCWLRIAGKEFPRP